MKKTLFVLLGVLLVAACAPAPVAPGALMEYSQGYRLTETTYAGDSAIQARALDPESTGWNSLHLTGSLILILQNINGPVLGRMDLTTGLVTKLFQADDGAILSSALVSPDHRQILLVYSPPATSNKVPVYTSLYLVPVDGSSAPFKIIQSSHPRDAFFWPVWAPDGKSVYTSHYTLPSADGTQPGFYDIDRVDLQGNVQEVVRNAEYPVLSRDGSQLAYVSASASTTQNELQLARSDGSGAHPVLAPGAYPAVDAHFFTPDGKTLLFSAVNQLPAPAATPTVLDRFFGVQVAQAHTIPSDWYTVPADGGEVQRITTLNATGMYAALAPAGDRMVFISLGGIYLMNLDGSGLTYLSNLYATGTVDWVP